MSLFKNIEQIENDNSSLAIKEFSGMKVYREPLKWRTMEGKRTNTVEMTTGHLFNCVKMHYNHFAELINLPTYAFTIKYDYSFDNWKYRPKETLDQLKRLVIELEDRTDWLSIDNGDWQLETYKLIKKAIENEDAIKSIKKMIEDQNKRKKEWLEERETMENGFLLQDDGDGNLEQPY